MVEKKEEKTEEETPRSELTQLVLLRDQLQKVRIAESNRVAAYMRLGEPSRADVHQTYVDELTGLEDRITSQITQEVREHPAWPFLERVKGIAETSAAMVLGYIDIEKAPTVSALWRYAGFGVVDGKRERPVKGEKLHYNARLKTMVWRVIDLQVKSRGPYRKFYDDAKHTYQTTRPDWTKMHIELASRRKAAKIFLSHLWVVWREAEGLPTRSPWIEEHGGEGHTIIGPWELIEEFEAEQARLKRSKVS